jgi:hypothetical protein
MSVEYRSFDFRITGDRACMLLLPLTRAGRHWISDYLPKGERRLSGGTAIIPAERIQETLTSILLAGLSIAPLEE